MANLIYGLNFDVLFLIVVIASMVTMFSTELMAVVPIAIRFKDNKIRINVLSYIVPVWAVVGRFFCPLAGRYGEYNPCIDAINSIFPVPVICNFLYSSS